MTDADLLALSRARRRLPSPVLRRLIRERARLSQQELADRLGVSRPALTRWENGQRCPNGDVLVRYVALLDRLAKEVRAS